MGRGCVFSVQYFHMDPQEPITNNSTPVQEPVVHKIPKNTKDTNSITIISMAIFVLLSLGAVAFLYYQNQQLKSMLASYQTPTPTATPTGTPTTTSSPNGSASPSATLTKPIVTSPKPGTKVVSPLTITGTVPAGWMFEGVFPIKLVDAQKNTIVQGQAKEKTPGSWQSGNPVEFTATLIFTTTEKNGFIILENDNPSGDPTKSKTFEVPVKF